MQNYNMKININIIHFKTLYIFFIFLAVIKFFFSTINVHAKNFEVDNVEISQPFEINFDKKDIIDEGFQKAFDELISVILSSLDKKKINQIKLNEIKSMIETFSIKQERFINQVYFVNLGVTFNKKKVFSYLEKNNIFPSSPYKKKFLFIPIIIDEKKKDLLIFSKNNIFKEWKNHNEKSHLIEYILPTEDLEDLNTIKQNYELIEQYDFKEITNKYFLNDSIIALIFKSDNGVRVLSRISLKKDVILKNQSFSKINLDEQSHIRDIIIKLKTTYEDYWKNINKINTSIKLPLSVKIKNSENIKISNFEKLLTEMDLIYNFFISKITKDYVFYEIIFNGTPNFFLKSMSENNYNFDTQNKIWILK